MQADPESTVHALRDLRGDDLASMALARADLRRVDLRGVQLAGRDLSGADLRGAWLDGADLSGARFVDANLRGARLVDGRLAGADLSGADLRGANLSRADLREARLRDADLVGAVFDGADASGADLRRSEGYALSARGVRLSRAVLDGASWRLADLREAELSDAQGAGARFDRAQLGGAVARSARFEGAVFDEADVEQVDFHGTRLRSATFFAARGHPRFERADLRGADLRFDALPALLDAGTGPSRIEGARVRVSHAAGVVSVVGDVAWRPPLTVRLALVGTAWFGDALAPWVRRVRDGAPSADAPDEVDSVPAGTEAAQETVPSEPGALQRGRARVAEVMVGWRAYLFDPVDAATVDVEAELAFARSALERDHEARRSAMGVEARARLRVRHLRRREQRALDAASVWASGGGTVSRGERDARLGVAASRSERAPVEEATRAAGAVEPGRWVVDTLPARLRAAEAARLRRVPPAPAVASDAEERAAVAPSWVSESETGGFGAPAQRVDLEAAIERVPADVAQPSARVASLAAGRAVAERAPGLATVEAGEAAVPEGRNADPAVVDVAQPSALVASLAARAALAERVREVAPVDAADVAARVAVHADSAVVDVAQPSALVASLAARRAVGEGAPAPAERAVVPEPPVDDAYYDALPAMGDIVRASVSARAGRARAHRERQEAQQAFGAAVPPDLDDTAIVAEALARSAPLRAMAAEAWRARVRDALVPAADAPSPVSAAPARLALQRSADARLRRLEGASQTPSTWQRFLELLREPPAAEPTEDEVAAFAVAAQERDAEWSRAELAVARDARLVRVEVVHAVDAVARDAEARRAAHDRDVLDARFLAEARLRGGLVRHRRRDLVGAREEFLAARAAAAEVALREVEAPLEGPEALDGTARGRWVLARVVAAERRALAGRLDEERGEVLGLFTELSVERDAEVEAVARAAWRRAAILRAEAHADVALLPRRTDGTHAGGGLAASALGRVRARGGARPLALGPDAMLEGADLEGRSLAGANLRGARMARARLVSAELRDAVLVDADLHGADLSGAVLDGADLSGADLRGAILEGATLHGARLDTVRVEGATFLDVQGLTPEVRAQLLAGGADVGQGDEGRWFRVASGLVAVSLGAVMAVYLVARFTTPGTDDASIEQAATVAKQEGDPREAAQRFLDLASRADSPEARVSFLLEAASSFEDAGDTDAALARYAEAIDAAQDTPLAARVLLRRAGTERRVGLLTAAEGSYRALLARVDATPSELGDALAGLASVLGADGDAELAALQERILEAAPTPVARAGLALALADGWAGQGHLDRARSTLQSTLELGLEAEDALPLQLRLAHVLAQDGRGDEALELYRSLADVSPQARLGAAEILAKRGDVDAARTLLAPLLTGGGEAGARARLAVAGIAAREGDDATATRLLREVLAADGLEPRMADEARLLLARLLITKDPAAAAALAEQNPQIRGAILLGQARALRDAGNRTEARARWVTLSEDASLDPESRAEAALALAELDIEDGEADSAVRRYEQLMEDAQQVDLRRRVQIGYGAALVRLGRVQEAEARYRALADASGPGEVRDQAELGLARCAALRGQAAEAAQRYEAVAAREGVWGAEALLALGELREGAGDLEGAIAALRRARTREGLEADRRTLIDIRLARVLDASGDPAAGALYQTLLEAPDANVRVQARLAVAARTIATDPRAARDLYEAALQEIGPGAERAAARAGWLRASVALGEGDAGISRIRAWLETEREPGLRGELAIAAVRGLRAEGRLEEALALAERWSSDGGFELAMEQAGALRELGRSVDAAKVLAGVRGGSAEDEGWRIEARAEALLASGDLDGADEAYGRLGATAGAAEAARLGRARVARERGDLDGALILLSEVADPRAPMERAQVLEELGRISEAETTWKRVALSTDLEQRSAGVVGLARVRLSRDDAKGALEALAGLSAPDPGYALTYAQARGEALLAVGRFDEARAVYVALNADAEARVVGLLGQAEVDLAVDRPRDALPRFEAALAAATDPWYQAVARGGVVRALADSGDVTKARAAYASLLATFPDRDDVLSGAAAALGIER